MSTQNNKAICLAFLETVYTEGRHDDLINKVIASDAVDHELAPYALPYMTTPQMLAMFLTFYKRAFPDLQIEIQDMLAEGDRVATRWRLRGTHTGPLMGIDPSQQRIDVGGLRIDRFANGKIVETWGSWDLLGLLEQIGALPELRRVFYPELRSVAAA
ncbi:MAG TPA: ester cyclase [Thermoanaerobaculia bacterium]